MNLYPHNQSAYDAVMRHYNNGHRKAAVVHATGTGKSYIIAAVVSNFTKCLVIAPNDYVLNQTRKLCKPDTHFATYSAAMFDNIQDTDYDLIVLDEYHRAGAAEWGAAVRNVIARNPQAKLFGTTATDIRYLDRMRNMSDELFDGNVTSRLSLPEAWAKGILIPPIYITGLYTFDNIADKFIKRVKNNSRLSDEKKALALSAIEDKRLDWVRANGLADIFRKHLRPETRRVIVFCDHIQRIEEIKTQFIQWFATAGHKIHKTYTVNIQNYSSDKELVDFEKDDYEGIKVMFAVNMLNEGIHVPNVDAVVMLRPTTSKIIHLQQIGRCMTTDNNKQPIVFDLVDNIENSSVVADLRVEFETLRQNSKRDLEPKEMYDFIIEDYVMETRQVINRLTDTFFLFTFEDKFAEISDWCETNNRYPIYHRMNVSRMTEEQRKETNYRAFLFRYRDRKEVIDLREKYQNFSTMNYDQKVQVCVDFIEENKRLPLSYRGKIELCPDDRKEEDMLRRFIHNHREDNTLAAYLKKYENFRTMSDEDKKQLILDWCDEHNAIPVGRRDDDYERMLSTYIKRHFDEPFVKELCSKYNYKSKEDIFEDKKKALLDFCAKNNRLPSQSTESEKTLYNFFRSCQRLKNFDWIDELAKKYISLAYTASEDECIEIIRRFCVENNRVPSYKCINITENERAVFNLYSRMRNHPAIVEIRSKYPSAKTRTRTTPDKKNYFPVRKQQLIDFVNTNGFLPRHQSKGDEKVIANYWSRFRDRDEDVKRIYSEYPTYPQYCLRKGIEQLKEFIRTNHRPPSRKDSQYLCDLYYKKLKDDPEIKNLLNSK